MLSERALYERLGRVLERPLIADCAADTSLYDTLSLDSLDTFQLIVAVEALANCDVPPLDIPEMYTLGDVYGYYTSLIAMAADA